MEENCGLCENRRRQRWEIFAELNKISFYQESLEKQKVRTKWIALGDSYSISYHSAINWRRMKNGIKGLNIHGNGFRNLRWWRMRSKFFLMISILLKTSRKF